MPEYCVNKNAQPNGDHEVHNKLTCTRLPEPANQKDLGWHSNCHSAVEAAKEHYGQSNGCYYCCEDCHTT